MKNDLIKTVLIDDEIFCTQGLVIDIKETCPELEVIATFNSSKEAILAIPKLSPDLVFLDIEMPWKNGFDLLEALKPIDFQVIFVTAYDEFAVQAFRANANDYIMKPINRTHLRDAVEKIIYNRNHDKTDLKKIENLLNSLHIGSSKKLSVPNSDGYDLIPIEEILYCHSVGNYTEIFFSDRKMTVSRVLKSIEEILKENNFHRVHASYLVNLEKVKSIHRNDGGYLIMENGARINMSRNKKGDVFSKFK
jgi:two-component system LytT family response regulator